jgi:hypothetical protein
MFRRLLIGGWGIYFALVFEAALVVIRVVNSKRIILRRSEKTQVSEAASK